MPRSIIGTGAVVCLATGLLIQPAFAQPVDLGAVACNETVFHEEKVGAAGSGAYSLPFGFLPPPPGLTDALCAAGAPCFEYALTVSNDCADPVGAQLRIAYDTPARDDNFEMTIEDPEGVVTTRTNGNQYSVESFFAKPASGTWKIRMAPYSANDAPFRVRAKLEASEYVPAPNAQGQLLPNLRVTRLWEFGWAAPANPGNGLFPPDDVNPPLAAAGQEPVSCSVDEQLGFDGAPARRCLRYSFGLANVGDGVFDIRWNAVRGDTEHFAMIQCIEKASGPPESRAAGEGVFHPLHGHTHYEDIIHHEIFAVAYPPTFPNDPPVLTSTGTGKKIGYSPADQGMPLWNEFTQARSGTSGGEGNCAPGTNSRLGMSRGWGDAYRYQRPGNFVEFGTNGDGEYVVHTIADPENVVLESNEADNTSYAHVRMTGSQIELLETGLGTSPWDPNKMEYVNWWTQ